MAGGVVDALALNCLEKVTARGALRHPAPLELCENYFAPPKANCTPACHTPSSTLSPKSVSSFQLALFR